MDIEKNFPVYINYGKETFLKTYNLFNAFLETVPYRKQKNKKKSSNTAGIIISPRNNSGIPWCSLALGLLYLYKNFPITYIWDDLSFLDSDGNYQNGKIEDIICQITSNTNIPYIRVSELVDSEIDNDDYLEIERLANVNALWNIRKVVPSDELKFYFDLSYKALKENSKKIKTLYSNYKFDHCVHQSVVNNNGGLHKWFGNKNDLRISCIDSSLGVGLNGLTNVAGYYLDLPELISGNGNNLFRNERNKEIAIAEAKREILLRQKGKDAKTYQVVGFDNGNIENKHDVIIPINIFWDAAALGKNRFFISPYEWLYETIQYILNNTDLNIAVRQHPGERHYQHYNTGTNLGEHLKSSFGESRRFKFIFSEERVNTYNLIKNCKLVLPFTSTIGIEAALMGKTVIVESDVYYKDQPFVLKANTKEDYFTKIKLVSENNDSIAKDLFKRSSQEKAYLLYFLVNQCSLIYTNFGLDPKDFENWCLKGFHCLIKDENLMMAIQSITENIPFAFFNGMIILNQLSERSEKIIEIPDEDEINGSIKKIIHLINNGENCKAIECINKYHGNYKSMLFYPKAFAMVKTGKREEALCYLNKLLAIKPKHEKANLLLKELVKYIKI
jgi:hypothetical protein